MPKDKKNNGTASSSNFSNSKAKLAANGFNRSNTNMSRTVQSKVQNSPIAVGGKKVAQIEQRAYSSINNESSLFMTEPPTAQATMT